MVIERPAQNAQQEKMELIERLAELDDQCILEKLIQLQQAADQTDDKGDDAKVVTS